MPSRPADPVLIPERSLAQRPQSDLDAYVLELDRCGRRHSAYVAECAQVLDELVAQAKTPASGRIIGTGGFAAGAGWSVLAGDVIGVGIGVITAVAGSVLDHFDRRKKERQREPHRARLVEAVQSLRRIEAGIDAARRVYGLKGWSRP